MNKKNEYKILSIFDRKEQYMITEYVGMIGVLESENNLICENQTFEIYIKECHYVLKDKPIHVSQSDDEDKNIFTIISKNYIYVIEYLG